MSMRSDICIVEGSLVIARQFLSHILGDSFSISQLGHVIHSEGGFFEESAYYQAYTWNIGMRMVVRKKSFMTTRLLSLDITT